MNEVKTTHYITFRIHSHGTVDIDYNWKQFFAQMSDWDVEMIGFETGVNVPNGSTNGDE